MRPALALLMVLALAGCLEAAPLFNLSPPTPTYADRLLGGAETLHVAVHAVPDRTPSTQALHDLTVTLALMTGKTVQREPDRAVPWLPDQYTVEQLEALLRPLANAATPAGDLVLHVFAVNGNLTGLESLEGRAAAGLYLGDGLTVIFMDRAAGSLGTPIVDPKVPQVQFLQFKQERAVMIHEAGHAMGLVGCGTPMVEPHDDPASPCHSHSDRSVMWPGVHHVYDVDWYADGNMPDPVWEFDEDDVADVRAHQATLD